LHAWELNNLPEGSTEVWQTICIWLDSVNEGSRGQGRDRDHISHLERIEQLEGLPPSTTVGRKIDDKIPNPMLVGSPDFLFVLVYPEANWDVWLIFPNEDSVASH
jgi:hypothetical protein